jgi:hypothetical protein
MKKMETGPS